MIRQDGYSVGWVESSIASVLRSGTELLRGFRYVLVTSIDSARELPSLLDAQVIIERHPGSQFLGGGLLLPGEAVSEISSTFGLFTGFDEIWCFADLPSSATPDDVSLVAPLNLASEAVPVAVMESMRRSRCRLGLGDGIGMNYITPDESMAELLHHVCVP